MPDSKEESGVTIKVQVQPKASRDEIVGFQNGRVKVRVAAAPQDGKANERLREIMAEAVGVSKSSVQIIRGETSRLKTIRVLGVGQNNKFDLFMKRLKAGNLSNG
ncbi:MAG: DUF167 domain-containing protein [Ignavibacteriales bacterium]